MFPGRSSLFSPFRAYQVGLPRHAFNWSSFLTNAGKTLNVVNQAIPVFYQVKPIFSNMKTMFRVAHEFRNDTNNSNNETTQEEVAKQEEKVLRNPAFFK